MCNTCFKSNTVFVKVIVLQKNKILLSFTNPPVYHNLSSVEDKIRYFENVGGYTAASSH